MMGKWSRLLMTRSSSGCLSSTVWREMVAARRRMSWANWYLADLVLEIRVEGSHRNVVHINTVLVRASSSQQAHREAMKLGGASKSKYVNPQGKKVSVLFRGLHQLDAIHERLEHGAELAFQEKIGVSDES